MNEKTHDYKAPCGRRLHIIDSKEGLFIRTGKSGECPQILWEAMSAIINASKLPRKQLIETLKGYVCDKGVDGKGLPEHLKNPSCLDRIAKMLEEEK